MKPTRKSTKTTAEQSEVMENFFPLYNKGVERLAEIQKKVLDTAAQQNADWMDVWKKTAKLFPQAPGMFMFDVYGQMFDRFIETEKATIDLMVDQTKQATTLAKERGTTFGKAGDSYSGLLQQAMDQSIAAQKKTLDFYADAQKNAFDTIKKQFRLTNTPAGEAFQSGLDAIIETQKAMLDIASKPLHVQ